MTATSIDYDDFGDLLELVKERFEKWGEELHAQGWRGSIGMLLEGESDDEEWVSPFIGGGVNLERGPDHTPEPYEAEDQYRYGTDDEDYPVNEIHELLLKYTGTEPYWYNVGLKITPEDGVRMRVVG